MPVAKKQIVILSVALRVKLRVKRSSCFRVEPPNVVAADIRCRYLGVPDRQHFARKTDLCFRNRWHVISQRILPVHDRSQPKIVIGEAINANSKRVISVAAQAINRSREILPCNFPTIGRTVI